MRKPFLQLATERVVVLDGAMGANLQTRTFDLQRDWLGHENISEVINLTRPEVIQEIHESFLAVGCDGVETNTFGGMKIVLAEAGLEARCFEINKLAAEIARRACDKFETPDRPRYVIGSVGPGTKLISLGHISWDAMLDSYAEQMRGLLAGGADVLLLETMQDLLCIKCAINAARVAMKDIGREVPLMVQASFDLNNGANMLTGTDPEAFVATMAPYKDVAVLGLNCAFGPSELTESIHYIANHWPRLVSCLPNAGLPIMVDGRSQFPMTPPDFVKGVMRFVKEFGVNIVGGCCGTMPEHMKLLVEAVNKSEVDRGSGVVGREEISSDPHPTTHDPLHREGASHGEPSSFARTQLADPRTLTPTLSRREREPECIPQISSLVSAADIRQDNSYLIVAERTNTNGSKKFREFLKADDFDGLVSMARDELNDGSHMLDVCVDFVGRDGVRDMQEVVRRFVNALPAPLMLDSTDPNVMEAGLKLAGGRCVLNSMNLEDGEEKLGKICELAERYGAAVVAGCIDEDKEAAMARTRERKLAIAQRIRDLAVDRFGLRDEDLMFDPLVLPISTGIEEDRRNALETIEGTRLIAQHLPKCHTVVGLSNVSFGLKPAARIVLNSAFLHELRAAGLTGAIVHASKIQPQNRIPKEQWDAAMDLIHDRRREGFDPLTHFVGLFPDSGAVAVSNKADKYDHLSLEETLKQHIIDGEKRDLVKHLNEAMKIHPPLDIINNYLLDGMKVVGDLFGSGQMQLPFVLQSAETMKAAVAHLQPFMEKVEGQSKGKIVLATVKGDVHDIGKNLVDIILSNNGYTVYNLGIKQPIQDILRAADEHKADAIGMSGLLVKSVAVMKENLAELNARGIAVPVLLGGAALTREYAEEDLAGLYKGSLLYCKDAFDGLHVMDAINGKKIDTMIVEQKERVVKRKKLAAGAVKPKSAAASDIPLIAKDNPVPPPPFWGRRVVTDINPRNIFPFVNTNALFLGQWGLKKGRLSEEEFNRVIEQTARPTFERLQREALLQGFIQPKVVYGYFPVQSEKNDLVVYRPEAFAHSAGATNATCGCGAKHEVAPRCSLVPHSTPVEWLRFPLPRQQGRRNLCITDFFRTKESGQFDVLGVQLVTVGDAATELANQLREKYQYQEYLYLHGFGVECAEALAEFWHKRMRQELGFGSEDDPSIAKVFQQQYRGSRYSFGYPACPNLEDRAFIVDLLKPEEIGVSLSENYMLVPEQSTDALVVHHPQAKYFDV